MKKEINKSTKEEYLDFISTSKIDLVYSVVDVTKYPYSGQWKERHSGIVRAKSVYVEGTHYPYEYNYYIYQTN